MSNLSNCAHRLYLKLFCGREVWHHRYFRPSVSVVESDSKIWFEEAGLVVEALPLRLLAGQFSGRCNLLLSGPSVRLIEETNRLADYDLVAVNGSPGLFDGNLPRIKVYHVNDYSYIRGNLERFIAYSAAAEYTVVDYRCIYGLMAEGVDVSSSTNLVVADSWWNPFRVGKGAIERLTSPPSLAGVNISTDLSLGLAQGGSVAYTACQLLWLGGYTTVCLYGLDLTNSGRFYKEAKAQPQMLDKAYESTIEPAFRLLMKTTAPSGLKLYNCNTESRLPEEVMPRLQTNKSLTMDL
jgi:hypothetical protein